MRLMLFSYSSSQLRKVLRAGALTSVLLLSACASKQPAVSAATMPDAKPTNLANTGLTADFVYQYLVAEIAGQRGDLVTSSAVFYNLAKNSREPSLAERAAKIATYGKVPGMAVPTIKLWAELDPSSTEAQQAMTELHIATGKLDEAKPHLAKLLAKEDTRASGFLYLSTLLNKSPDKAATLKLVQSLAQPYPTLPEAHFAIAQSAYNAKQTEVALQALDKAGALKPGWDLAALVKGQVLFEKSPESAIAFYNTFLTQYPASNEVRISLTRTLINQKQYEEAKKQYPILIKNAADNKEKNAADVSALVGLMAMQTEDYTEATQYFEQSIQLGFKDTDQIYFYLAQVAEKQKNHAQAQTWYQKIKPDSDHFLNAQIGIANIIANTQTADKAIEYLDAVENLTTEQQIIVIQTEASLLSKANRDKESFELLDKAVKNMPNTPELMYDYALAAERVKKFDLMETELRKVMANKPDFAAAYNALGYSFADRNTRLNEALTLIEKALSFNPNDHYMLDSLGWVHYRKGNLNKALDLLQQSFKVSQDPEIAAHLGEVLWKKGKKEEAKKIWQESIKANPNNQVLLDTMKRFGL